MGRLEYDGDWFEGKKNGIGVIKWGFRKKLSLEGAKIPKHLVWGTNGSTSESAIVSALQANETWKKHFILWLWSRMNHA